MRSEIRVRDNMPCVVKMIRKANCRKVNSVRNLNREISVGASHAPIQLPAVAGAHRRGRDRDRIFAALASRLRHVPYHVSKPYRRLPTHPLDLGLSLARYRS